MNFNISRIALFCGALIGIVVAIGCAKPIGKCPKPSQALLDVQCSEICYTANCPDCEGTGKQLKCASYHTTGAGDTCEHSCVTCQCRDAEFIIDGADPWDELEILGSPFNL